MIQFDEWWLPDGETHLPQWMTQVNDRVDGRLRYQGAKYDAVLRYCGARRLAVDVGAHVGLWSFWMARDFGTVHAFEPHPDHQACWRQNMAVRPNAVLWSYALGVQAGWVALTTGPSSSGDTYVTPNGCPGRIPMRRLDDLGIQPVDLLKIDCEGGEYFVLQGGFETIRTSRPVIIVEQKPGHGQKYGLSDRAGADFLLTMGYRVRETIQGDVILTPR